MLLLTLYYIDIFWALELDSFLAHVSVLCAKAFVNLARMRYKAFRALVLLPPFQVIHRDIFLCRPADDQMTPSYFPQAPKLMLQEKVGSLARSKKVSPEDRGQGWRNEFAMSGPLYLPSSLGVGNAG